MPAHSRNKEFCFIDQYYQLIKIRRIEGPQEDWHESNVSTQDHSRDQ